MDALKKKYTIYFAKVNTGTADKPAFATSYVIIPEGMDPKGIRCVLWTPGSKEIPLADGVTLPFRSGEKNTPAAGLRLPADFDKDEGAYTTDTLDPVHAALAHHGFVRMGTLHHAYPDSMKRLAEVSGIKELANLPFVTTGASAAGGSASAAARKFPDRAVASCPTLIGAAGIERDPKTPLPPAEMAGDLPPGWLSPPSRSSRSGVREECRKMDVLAGESEVLRVARPFP